MKHRATIFLRRHYLHYHLFWTKHFSFSTCSFYFSFLRIGIGTKYCCTRTRIFIRRTLFSKLDFSVEMKDIAPTSVLHRRPVAFQIWNARIRDDLYAWGLFSSLKFIALLDSTLVFASYISYPHIKSPNYLYALWNIYETIMRR